MYETRTFLGALWRLWQPLLHFPYISLLISCYLLTVDSLIKAYNATPKNWLWRLLLVVVNNKRTKHHLPTLKQIQPRLTEVKTPSNWNVIVSFLHQILQIIQIIQTYAYQIWQIMKYIFLNAYTVALLGSLWRLKLLTPVCNVFQSMTS